MLIIIQVIFLLLTGVFSVTILLLHMTIVNKVLAETPRLGI